MVVRSLRCNHCGANLKIQPKVNFFTCAHCGSSLTIKESGNTLYTVVLGEIKENTDRLIDHSERLVKEQEIERLDREWMLSSEEFRAHRKNNVTYYSDVSNSGSTIIGVIIGIIVFFLMGVFIGTHNSGPRGGGIIVVLFFLFVIGLVIYHLQSNNNKAMDHVKAEEIYLTKRKRMLKELDE